MNSAKIRTYDLSLELKFNFEYQNWKKIWKRIIRSFRLLKDFTCYEYSIKCEQGCRYACKKF